MRTFRIVMAVLLSGLSLACGGGDTNDEVVADEADTTGDEVVSEPEAEVVAEPIPDEPEPPPVGPVDVTVAIKVGNDDAAGTVALVNADGETVAEGNGGQTFNVTSGYYQITATIGDDSVLIDTPSQTQDVTLAAGEAQTVEVRFPRARVLLNVTRNGRPLRRPEVTLYRQGSEEPSATFRVGRDHVPISPGRYEADVKLRGHEIRVRGLTFMDGATQSIPVNIE